MSRALLQVSQMIEPKFLQKPLGADEATRTRKQKEAVELQLQGLTPSKIKEQVWEGKRDENAPAVDDDTAKRSAMERWQDALDHWSEAQAERFETSQMVSGFNLAARRLWRQNRRFT